MQGKSFMQTALKLARRGFGNVEPNPLVGCVIVRDGKVIGKGYHKQFGGPHAEINAIADARDKGHHTAGSTMYVTLEPCCHEGKTGPCTDAVIAAGIDKVVIATADPSEKVGGRGIRQLRAAGIDVEIGLLQGQAQLINSAFFKFAKTHQPWIVLKWAQSIDGKLAWTKESDKRWISNEASRKDAHRLRRSSQAIVVGVNTVKDDNPLLTPRPPKNTRPLRVVLDSMLRIPLCSRILKTKRFDTMVVTTQAGAEERPTKIDRILDKGVDILGVPQVEKGCDIHAVIEEMGKRGVQQVLVEGGPSVLASFLKEGLADAVRVYVAPIIMGAQGQSEISATMSEVLQGNVLKNVEITNIEGDACISGVIN